MIYPRRYIYSGEERKRKAYCNACDCIAIYGVKKSQWNYVLFGLSKEEMDEIWNIAHADMNGQSKYDFIYERRQRKCQI